LVAPEELHHHDVVHFALDEVKNRLKEGQETEIVDRLRDHLGRNREKCQPPPKT
jgi:hypothetical protein